MGFRENLKSELQYKGMTVRELAELSGVNKQTIDNYLSIHNSMPSADVAVKISKVLEVSVEYLITGKDSSPVSVSRYAPEVRKIADQAQAMSPYERHLILALINAIAEKNKISHQS